MSKHTEDRIYFPVPIVESSPSQRPEVKTMSVDEKKEIYRLLRDAAEEEGFSEGAVVCFKFKASTIPALNPDNWGIVSRLVLYLHNENEYRPITVRWIANGKPDSTHFPEELFLIHRAPDPASLRLSLQAQSEDLP